MTRRSLAVAQNVAAAIAASEVPVATIAKATDILLSDLNDRLSGLVEFKADELMNVGGFLHIRPSTFLKGAAA